MTPIQKHIHIKNMSLSLQQLCNFISMFVLGASGVAQAMVLSFGNFQFRNQHLEFNLHPQFLHRDFHFR